MPVCDLAPIREAQRRDDLSALRIADGDAGTASDAEAMNYRGRGKSYRRLVIEEVATALTLFGVFWTVGLLVTR